MKWEEVEIGEVIEFYNHKRIPLSGVERENLKGIYPYYGAQGIIDYINDFIFEGKYILVAEDGENLRSRNQPIARFAEGQFWVNNHAHILRGKVGVSNDTFILSILNFLDLGAYVTGAAQPKLSMGNLRKVKIQLPTLPIQQKIASILSTYDDLIENNLKRIRLLEEAAQHLYREWFVRFLFPGWEGVEVVDGLPEGWKRGTVGQICKVKSGYAFKSKDWQQTGNRVIKITNIGNNTVDTLNCDCVDDSIAKIASKFELFTGEIVIAMTGATVGKVGLIPRIENPIFLNQRVGVFKSNLENQNFTAFLFAFFMSDDAQRKVLNLAQGAAQPNISTSQIENIEVVISTENILVEFCRLTNPFLDQFQILHYSNQKLKEARDILLPRLMNQTIEV